MFKALKNITKACLSEIIVLLVARCVWFVQSKCGKRLASFEFQVEIFNTLPPLCLGGGRSFRGRHLESSVHKTETVCITDTTRVNWKIVRIPL